MYGKGMTDGMDISTLEDGLRKSMDEEAMAARVYRGRAAAAYEDGDAVTARLWEHVAEEEDIHYNEFRDRLARVRAEEVLGRISQPLTLGGYYWEVTNMVTGEIMQYDRQYPTTDHAIRAARDLLDTKFSQFAGQHLVIKVFDKSPGERSGLTYTPVRSESYWVGEVGQPSRRPFPKAYGDWVNLAEDIKAADPDSAPMVNYHLGLISRELPGMDNAKRWLVRKAGELGIG